MLESTGIYYDSNTILSSVANSTSFLPRLLNQNNRLVVTFRANILKMNRNLYNHGKTINICITYRLQKRNNYNADMTLENSLFGAIECRRMCISYQLFTEQNKKFSLSLHYNGDNTHLFVNGIQQVKFKTKD